MAAAAAAPKPHVAIRGPISTGAAVGCAPKRRSARRGTGRCKICHGGLSACDEAAHEQGSAAASHAALGLPRPLTAARSPPGWPGLVTPGGLRDVRWPCTCNLRRGVLPCCASCRSVCARSLLPLRDHTYIYIYAPHQEKFMAGGGR